MISIGKEKRLPVQKYFDFEVSLLEVQQKIWRRFLIEERATFDQLHEAIQTACGWENYHLYSFQDKKGNSIAESPHGRDFSDFSNAPDGRKVKLWGYFEKKNDICMYLYDFGDNWEHLVKLNGIIALPEKFKRRLLDGERAFPPEDCGGVGGYENCLSVLNGEDSAGDREELLAWLGDWNPEAFDPKDTASYFNK